MTEQPHYNPHAVRADILRSLDLTAHAAEGYANYHRTHNLDPASPALAAHHAQIGKVMRRLHVLAGNGLLDHLAAIADDEDDTYETEYEARYAWHTIRLYRGTHPLDLTECNLVDQTHPAQCSTLPPGAVCWFGHDPRHDWWPTWDQHGTYRIRPGFQLVGGGPDGDDPDVHEYFDIQVLDENTGAWRDWNGRTVGEAELEAATPAAAPAEDDSDTVRLKRARLEPLTENVWTEIRAFAWSPRYEAPAGTPARYGLELLRTALAEAERLAGRAHSNRSDARALAEILAKHRVMALVDGVGRTPQLYTDLMEWLALAVERETYRLREQGVNPLPDRIPARVKAYSFPDNADGQVQIRKRPIPDQLDWLGGQLATEVANAEFLPSSTVTLLLATVVNLGAAAAELRAQAVETARLRDHAEAVELLGHLVDHEDTCCNLDGRGYCLEHHNADPCEVPAARALLARIRSEQPGGAQ